jgi:hypothetical protein
MHASRPGVQSALDLQGLGAGTHCFEGRYRFVRLVYNRIIGRLFSMTKIALFEFGKLAAW